MSSAQTFPTVKVWIFALIISALFLLPFQFYFMDQEYFVFNKYILEQAQLFFDKSEPDKKNIIIIGNSRTRSAFSFQDESKSKHFRYFRIILPRSSFKEFIPVLEEIIKYHPDIIFVQADLLSRVGFNLSRKSDIIQYLMLSEENLIQNLDYLARNTLEDDLRFNKSKFITQIDDEKHVEMVLKATTIQKEIVYQFNSFSEMAAGKNTKTILLDIPRGKSLNDTLRTFPAFQESEKYLDSVFSSKAANYLSFMSNLPDSFYMDNSHFKANGRKLFSSLFTAKIDSILETNN